MQKVIITTASNLSDETYRYICDRFFEKIGEAEFERIVDDGIIGGFIANVNGKIYDLSVASQLSRMKSKILNPGGEQ